ncbi:uncharacterized protein [Argopecten irradians]|uniref:uncharacterized protein n=1 Tax=Argopecten irradians TaxID=31199 RepID=UPI0037144F43
MESFTALFIAMELIFHCISNAIVRGKAVSFRGFSLVSRAATSLAVAVSQRLSLPEAVVVFFTASFDCTGEDSPSLADDEPATLPAPAPVSVRRSGRVRRAPAWHKDYDSDTMKKVTVTPDSRRSLIATILVISRV